MNLELHPEHARKKIPSCERVYDFLFRKGSSAAGANFESSEWKYCAQSRPRPKHQWVG